MCLKFVFADSQRRGGSVSWVKILTSHALAERLRAVSSPREEQSWGRQAAV